MKTLFSRSYLLLSAQLLVCLFVSSLIITSSNSYADSSRTWTEDEVKNLLYNYYVNLNNKSESDTLSFIENNESNIQTLVTFLNTQSIIVIYINQNYGLTFLGTRSSNKVYYSNNRIGFNSSYTDSKGYYFKNDFTYNNRRLNDFNSYSADMSYYYTNSPIYDNTYTNVLYAVGYFPSTFFDNWYFGQLGLYFVSRLSDTNADVWVYEDVPVYYFSGDEDLYIGQLFQPLSFQGYETNNNFFYMWGNWQYRDLTSYCTYTEYIGSDERGSLYDVYLDKNYFYSNTLYNLVWTDTSTDPYSLAAANFYLGDENTVIIDGVIDPSKTFSGDYKDQYDYENDPNENFWRNTYNRLMTPSGEVLRDTITSLMSDLDFSASGDESGELMMALAGLDVISNDFGDFIISWDDFSPNLTIKGQSVSSSGPFIPAGQINFSQMERNNETFHDIMQYTRAILSFSVIVLFFNNLWHTLLITLGISTQIYEKDQLAKEKLVRQAERDQRRQEREDRQRYQQWLYEHRR